MNKSVSIITDLDGSKIALINDIRFKSRKGIDWNEVEQYLKEYIGEYFEISETSEKIYIGSDFPDEFSHSNDTKGLKGANMKAKANITPAIGELIQIASEKAQYPDYKNKHGAKAQFGCYSKCAVNNRMRALRAFYCHKKENRRTLKNACRFFAPGNWRLPFEKSVIEYTH